MGADPVDREHKEREQESLLELRDLGDPLDVSYDHPRPP
jgi:hypothetical protein